MKSAIFNQAEIPEMVRDEQEDRWQAVLARDKQKDGQFVFAVSSTGVYCRPSCSAKHPRRENVSFFNSPEDAESAGYRACLRCCPRAKFYTAQSAIVKAVCRYIERHLDEPLTLAVLSEAVGQSPFYLQRSFKAALGISPRAYADSCRMDQFKRNLRAGQAVTRAMFDAGYSSSSRVYEKSGAQLGMTPDEYRRGAVATLIRYTFADSPLGFMLIAATDRGVCAIQFGDSHAELETGLKREFPFAVRRRDDVALAAKVQPLLAMIRGHKLPLSFPLDIQATAFQRRVWDYLLTIPRGATQSYRQVAKAIGRPTAARAVARACATNRVAVAIPCHRVIREDGHLGGYRWGLARKELLLEMEHDFTSAKSGRRSS